MLLPAQVPPPTANPIPDADLFNLDEFLDGLLATTLDPGLILPTGRTLWTGLASIVVAWTGLRIAYSGNFQPWELVRLLFGLGIPLWMLEFYTTDIPGTARTFPETISAGGNWLLNMFLDDTLTQGLWQQIKTLFGLMGERVLNSGFSMFAIGASIYQLVYSIMFLPLVALMFAVMFAIGYAQILWAKAAMTFLIFIGPILIPWLVFQPMAFLFWGWFKSMFTFALYAAIAGAMFRVWGDIALDYLVTLHEIVENGEIHRMQGMILATCALAIASILAMLRIPQLANMLVTGSGAPGSGFLGVAGSAAGLGGAASAGGRALKPGG